MRKHLLLPVLLLATSFGSHCQNIPTVKLQALDGTSVAFPADLQGHVTVLVLGFTRKSSAETVPWLRFVEHEFSSDQESSGLQPRMRFYQLPVLASVPSMFRGLVLRNIRAGVPATSRAHMLPVLTDEQDWKSLVHFSAPDDAYVLVLDATGKVAWRISGAPTADSTRAVAAKVRELEALPAR